MNERDVAIRKQRMMARRQGRCLKGGRYYVRSNADTITITILKNNKLYTISENFKNFDKWDVLRFIMGVNKL